MSSEPQFPVAVITDEGLAVVYTSVDSLSRDIEPADFPQVILIDTCERAFFLRGAADRGLLDKLASALGAPNRLVMEPFPGVIRPELLAAAKAALSKTSQG